MWMQICDDLRARWPGIREEGTWCALVLALDGELQRLVVQPVADAGLVIAAHVCALEHVPALDALAYNARAPRGHLAIDHGAYVLRERRALALAGLDGALVTLGTEAARLRRRVTTMTARTSPNVASAHYAD